MFASIKRLLYFPVASYFRFFARIRLKKWNPRVIVITGSSGKTTLLHLVESQLGSKAKYSHEANSSFGIPFDILGIRRKDLTWIEWPSILLSPWLSFFKDLPEEKIYVVEADCDRPHEGDFLSSLLLPEVTLWTNVSRTHAANFGGLVSSGRFSSVDDAITYEFGFFARRTKNLVITKKDSSEIREKLKRTQAMLVEVSGEEVGEYVVGPSGTSFRIGKNRLSFPYLFPEEVGVSVLMCLKLMHYLGLKPENSFKNLTLPPGRNSLFKGVKGITIVDSTYNANLDSMGAIINMFGEIKANKKWVVLGDMLELGDLEKDEHGKLAKIIAKHKFERIILMGPRVGKYTYPALTKKPNQDLKIELFLGPKEVLEYLLKNLEGGEMVLFKGARFLEGVVERLLIDKSEASRLARREKAWQIRRKRWGLVK